MYGTQTKKTKNTNRSSNSVHRKRIDSSGASKSKAAGRTLRSENSSRPMQRLSSMQNKLAIGKAGDAYEREADAVSDDVVAERKAPEISRMSAGGMDASKDNKSQQMPLQRQEEGGDEAAQKEEAESAQAEGVQEDNKAAQANEESGSVQTRLVQRQEDSGDETAQKEEAESAQTESETAQANEEGGSVQTRLVQRQEDSGDEAAQKEEETAQAESDTETAQSKTLQRQADDEAAVQTKSIHGKNKSKKSKSKEAAIAISNKGSGQPLSPEFREKLESGIGADFSAVRVHSDSKAQQAASALNAKAFTHGHDIWLGKGQSADDLSLMAHEATHVVQQNSASDLKPDKPGGLTSDSKSDRPQIQKATAESPANPSSGKDKPGTKVAPGFIELKGQPMFEPEAAIDEWLTNQPRKTGLINMRFGSFAEGSIKVKKQRSGYRIRNEFMSVKHEMFSKIGEVAPQFKPGLIISTNKKGDKVSGYVGLAIGKRMPKGGKDFIRKIKKAPEILGLQGLDIPKLPNITNEIAEGNLRLGLNDVPVNLGRILKGQFSFEANDERVNAFNGNLSVEIPKLASFNMELSRTAEGKTKGKADGEVKLSKNITGTVVVIWEDGDLSGEGTVQYSGDKFSGKVTVKVMDKKKADQLEQEKKAPEKTLAKKAPAKAGAKKKPEYVLFGEGEVDVEFSEWLHGNAQVIIDPKGYLTVIGKITPKDFELFPQKDYVKQLFKLEARASYGIPVVGNIFIFANIGADAFAKIGPGKFYKISIDGTYSNDPKKAKDFSIRGSFNISAAAGLRLRGEAGAGLEILAHDIKAGAGINGIAGIQGYAEATPVIGYREQAATQGEDKKGEFFMRGDLEIAAQPFLGLSGDLFVEIDAPWWSPVPDKKWTWPLGSKEWPVGGSLGLNASVDYVFGSGKVPAIELKPVEFDSDKFLTDLYTDKAQPKSKKSDKQGSWKEKNTKTAEPPKKEKAGNAEPGKASPLPDAKSKVKAGGPKKDVKPANPNARTAEGKSVKDYQDEARQKKAKPSLNEPLKGKGKEETTDKSAKKTDHQDKWQRGVTAVVQALKYAEKTGIEQKELNSILKKIKKRKEYGFKKLYAIEDEKNNDKWVVMGSMSPEQTVSEIKKKAGKLPDTKLSYSGNPTTKVEARPLTKKGKRGSEAKRATGWPGWWQDVERFDKTEKDNWVRMHLIHSRWGSGKDEKNLVPANKGANKTLETDYEHPAIKLADDEDSPEVLWYTVNVSYRNNRSDLSYGNYFPATVTLSYGKWDDDKKDKVNTIAGPRDVPVQKPPIAGVEHIPTINSTDGYRQFNKLDGVTEELALFIVEARNKKYIEGRNDLWKRIKASASERLINKIPNLREHLNNGTLKIN